MLLASGPWLPVLSTASSEGPKGRVGSDAVLTCSQQVAPAPADGAAAEGCPCAAIPSVHFWRRVCSELRAPSSSSQLPAGSRRLSLLLQGPAQGQLQVEVTLPRCPAGVCPGTALKRCDLEDRGRGQGRWQGGLWVRGRREEPPVTCHLLKVSTGVNV